MAIVDRVGARALSFLEFVGALATFGGRAIVDAFRSPYEVGEISDVIPATLKTIVFGYLIAVVASLSGLHDESPHRGRWRGIDA